MIRHGEKPPKDENGDDVNGLSDAGLNRAQGLVGVFGSASSYNIRYILAEHPKKDGSRTRPLETVSQLATELGISVDDSVDRDDAGGAAKAAKAHHGPGNVLICWEHGQLAKIAKELGVKGYAHGSGASGKVKYPDDRFDLIWTVMPPYEEIASVTSEDIQGLDDGHENP
ncbi:hypothetical protein GP486_003524 [Trichoglossum hirsutum]|uniref:Phosphoglycerate mutase family protein n=1 Tax=Trichoglossum hirsutum TaxID=265104 RepID=A0A9P8LCG1_9PEZI|nr:hypothetical protein GP486_003524 [Trichoglossum hirsutum]